MYRFYNEHRNGMFNLWIKTYDDAWDIIHIDNITHVGEFCAFIDKFDEFAADAADAAYTALDRYIYSIRRRH